MCDPVSLIGFGISAASTMMNYQAEKDQAKYQNKLAIAQAENAAQATRNDYQQSALRDIEEENAAAQKVQMQVDEARRAQATARVSAGESGVAGLSVDALMRDIQGQGLSNVDVVNQNLAMARRQSGADRQSIFTTGKGRVNEAASSMKTKPSALGAALQIGAAGYSSYQDYRTKKG